MLLEYYHMAYVGLLPRRVELIDGVIYETDGFDPLEMRPYGLVYRSIVNRLNAMLVRAVGESAIVQCQGYIRCGELCEAQPEFALLAPREQGYRKSEPRAADTLLVIEVSDRTLRHDVETKLPLYARNEVPELWVFDVQGKRLRTYRKPVGMGMTRCRFWRRRASCRSPHCAACPSICRRSFPENERRAAPTPGSLFPTKA
jgi:hypothetical protein